LVAAAGMSAVTAPASAAPLARDVPAKCVDGTNIRSSWPSGAVLGSCYSSHSVTVHCNNGNESNFWYNATDNSTGVSGWMYAGYVDVGRFVSTSPC
jgi:hypothetical protein